MRLVVVEWVDSHYGSGWHRDPPIIKSLLCRSAGWLIYDGDEAIVIAGHITVEDDPQREGEMTIPRQAVLRIEDLPEIFR